MNSLFSNHRWHLSLLGFAFCFILPSKMEVFAGATASQWVIAVNGQSAESRALANYYCELRHIPSRNVIVLNDVPFTSSITADEFREKILFPLRNEIAKRGLWTHIQGIAYSIDFPTAVNIASEISTLESVSPYLTLVGSLNGLTYLHQLIANKSPNILSMDANLYACRDGEALLSKSIVPSVQEAWKNLEVQLSDGNEEEAKKTLADILKKFPGHFGLTYRAAQLWAKQGKVEAAIELLEIAIAQGWCYRDHLIQDPALEPLRGESSFQILRDTCPEISFSYQRTRGFDARYYWTPSGIPVADNKEGMPYLLSTMLAVVREEGSTFDEALKQLELSSKADFTSPKGTFYFTKTSDVRTTTREPGFAVAIERLKALGYEGMIIEDKMPMFKKDCLGVTMGISNFRWEASASKLLPGAIAENLTSLGGVYGSVGGQTKLTEFLKHGAAGSSGTVTEPYSIQAKFPHPMIHAHYAEGCTLAEAFYLSVTGPYQLLIVGDPLCQPFARPPKLKIEGIQNFSRLPSRIPLKLEEESGNSDAPPARIDVFLDGKYVITLKFNPRIQMDIGKDIPGGSHLLTMIVTDGSHLQRKWESQWWVSTGEGTEQVSLTPVADTALRRRGKGKFKIQGPAGASLKLRHHWETIAELPKSEGTIEVDLDRLGHGPIRLQAVALLNDQELYSFPYVVDHRQP